MRKLQVRDALNRRRMLVMRVRLCRRAISVLLGEQWKKMRSEERRMFTQQAKALADEQKRLNPDCWKRKRTNSVRPLPCSQRHLLLGLTCVWFTSCGFIFFFFPPTGLSRKSKLNWRSIWEYTRSRRKKRIQYHILRWAYVFMRFPPISEQSKHSQLLLPRSMF